MNNSDKSSVERIRSKELELAQGPRSAPTSSGEWWRGTHAPSSLAVNRTVGRLLEVLDKRPVRGRSPTAELANKLGIALKAQSPLNISGITFSVPSEIDTERRDKFGYGYLSSDLIRRVESEVGFLMPSHTNVDMAYRLAGHVMHIVMGDPLIFRSDLDDKLAERIKIKPLTAEPTHPLTVVALSGVIDLTHELTAQYIEINPADARQIHNRDKGV